VLPRASLPGLGYGTSLGQFSHCVSVDCSRRSNGDERVRRHEEIRPVEGIPDSNQCL
jgi:hypothetical protein